MIFSILFIPLVISFLAPFSFTHGFKSPKSSSLELWPTDEWLTSTPEEQGMNSTYISMMYDYIYNNSLNIGSILIIRNGIIVEENYLENHQVNESMTQPSDFYNWGTVIYNTEGKLRNWFSTTKSISALLIGIAIKNGFIDNVSQTFFEFFPDKWNSSYDPRKLDITIEHLLRMTSGIPWPFQPQFWSVYDQEDNPDYIDDVLALNLTNDPGDPYEDFDVQYSTDAPNLLTAIIHRATGMYPEDFARQYLFEPLGIAEEDWGWYKGATGINWGGSGLSMHRRGMAKIAYLCLMNGTWDGTQILSKEYLQEALSPGLGSMGSYYGYLFYLDNYTSNFNLYYASGAFGQIFYVVPELDLIFLVNGWSMGEPSRKILLSDYIIPSILNYTDTDSPTILINSPITGEIFGNNAPSFDVWVFDPNLDSVWYELENKQFSVNTPFNGNIDQVEWSTLSEGNHTITFYANDTLGQINSEYVTVTKRLPSGGVIGLDYLTTTSLILIVNFLAIIIIIKRIRTKSQKALK